MYRLTLTFIISTFLCSLSAQDYYKPSVVDYVYLSGGYMMSNNNAEMRSKHSGYTYLTQYQDMLFSNAGMGFNLSNSAKFKIDYQMYNTNVKQYTYAEVTKSQKLNQHQVVALLEFAPGNNVSWGLAGGYYNIQTISNAYLTAYSAHAFYNKRFSYVQPEIALSFSNFGNWRQYQAEGSLTYYPLGNLNFYGKTKFAYIHNDLVEIKNQYVFGQSLGVRLVKQLWLDGSVSIGDHMNYITGHSFLVYDTYDPVKAIVAASLSYYFRKLTLSAGYQWQQREGYAYKFGNHLINAAIQWNF